MIAGKKFLFAILLLLPLALVAQKKTKSQLQREKQESLEKIKEVERILSETADKKQNSLGELSALTQRIVEQEKLINSIKEEINYLNGEIAENNDIITALEDDLAKLKKEYAAMLFAAQKANNRATRLTFLFSARSFEQLVMRLRYMEQYSQVRKLQVDQIGKVQDELSGQVVRIENQRSEKNQLLTEQISESNNLAELKKKENALVKRLEKEEKKLRKDFDETKKLIATLDKKINEIIKEEMEREAALAASAGKKNTELSSSFENNKNKFPWPVSGFISQKFGTQPHPILKNVEINNEGVNIQTILGEKVKAIFSGEVRRVVFIPGLGTTVLIKHGEYYTVYSGMKEVFVKVGQTVSVSQEIGTMSSNLEGVAELKFQLYKDKTPLNPEHWLKAM